MLSGQKSAAWQGHHKNWMCLEEGTSIHCLGSFEQAQALSVFHIPSTIPLICLQCIRGA